MGAWTQFYYYDATAPKMQGEEGGIIKMAVESIQQELHYNSYDPGLIDGIFGPETRKAVVAFQKAKLILADGVVGPITAKKLFRRRIKSVELKYEIPNEYLCGLIKNESNFDPGATGYVDPRDRGLLQINSKWHPGIDDHEAFDPSFSIPWGGQYLAGAFNHFLRWDAAIASYNAGYGGASTWIADKTINPNLTDYVKRVMEGC